MPVVFVIPLRTNAVRTHAKVIPVAFYLKTSSRRSDSRKGRVPALDYIKASFEKYVRFYLENYNDESKKNLPEIKYSTMQYFIEVLTI